MDKQFHIGNRKRFYEMMKPDSVVVLFAGEEVRKTNDEYYPFFADRSFAYMTGIEQKRTVFMAVKGKGEDVKEYLYVLPSNMMEERWTGRRLTKAEAEEVSGVTDIRERGYFERDLQKVLGIPNSAVKTGRAGTVYVDLLQASASDLNCTSRIFLNGLRKVYPYLNYENANTILRKLRLIKQPCEIEAFRKAEKITGEAIRAMMKVSKPGMYEYQYKAEFDRVLGQYGPMGPGFPSIISAGKNNFCIHYYSYTGCAQDGDMILNDVGAQWDNHIVDVSRGWPCNGRYTEKQKILYNCALATSNHMFEIIKPGDPMDFVDAEIRRYNAERLKDAGVLSDVKDIGTYMWHSGAHHIGYDVHDVVEKPEKVAPGMVFCIDVGIYHEEWGIGFRIEDNMLVTERGCENLSAAIPREIADIESIMRKNYIQGVQAKKH